MDRRRSAIAILSLAVSAASPRVASQPSARPRRLGVLYYSNPVAGRASIAYFTDELAKLGWVEGQNLQSTYRYADGDLARFPALAAELVALEPDVLFATTATGSLALAHATSRIPIVMSGSVDPVAMGLVKSLAHPGGNVTGTAAAIGSEYQGKQLEILKDWLPRFSRLAVIHNPLEADDAMRLATLHDHGNHFGLRIDSLSVGNLSELRSAIDTLRRDPPDAVYIFGGSFSFTNRDVICAEILRVHLPTITGATLFTESGCLASYTYSLEELQRENARFVDQILRGANPAETPVRQPKRFEFVINARTATSLGLAIPPKLSVMADRLIE
jgi:putative ABC transport system substrate-binding protein